MIVCPLSAKQLEVVNHFADGESAKSAGRIMGSSHNTVEGYLHIARLKLGVKTTTAVVATCLRNGWIQ